MASISARVGIDPFAGLAILALLASPFVVVRLVVLGGYALGAWHVVRLLRKPPELARRGRMLTTGKWSMVAAVCITD